MNITRFVVILAIVIIFLPACGVSPAGQLPDVEQQAGIETQAARQTMAQAEIIAGTLAALPSQGVIEIRIRMNLENEQQCIKTYPFILLTGNEQVQVDCQFKGDYCEDACTTLNIHLDLASRLDGEVVSDQAENGAQMLSLYFFYDGQLLEYYSDFPDDVPMTFTESTPLRETIGDLIPVRLPFEDGASAHLMGEGGIIDPDSLPILLDATLWELTLHIK